jgi:hypothetical protein
MTRAVILVPALNARRAGRPGDGRGRTAVVLISWRSGAGVPRYPAPAQAGTSAARPAPGGTRGGDR